MPKRGSRKGHLNINGKLMNKGENSCLKALTFRDIGNHISKNDFITPECQRDLDEGRLEDLLKVYVSKKNPSFFMNETRPIQLGIFDGKTYIIDGQHRLTIIPKLCNEYGYYDHLIMVYIEQHSTMDEINQRFIDANIDNTRLPIPVDELKSGAKNQFYTELKALLKQYYKKSFATNSKNLGKITIDQLMNDLGTNHFKSRFQLTDSNKAFLFLVEKSKKFIEDVDYMHFINTTLLVGPEKNVINSGMIFSLKRNNSIKWLFDDKLRARHQWRQKKKKISKTIRRRVWNDFSSNSEECCPLCVDMISIDNFHASHIIPEAKGGKVLIDNLVPLCSKCNIEMGTKTMEEYCIEIGVDFKDKLSWCKQNSTCQPSVSNNNQSNSSIIDLLVPEINSSNDSQNLPMPSVFQPLFPANTSSQYTDSNKPFYTGFYNNSYYSSNL